LLSIECSYNFCPLAGKYPAVANINHNKKCRLKVKL
jgi:hypothetical protein